MSNVDHPSHYGGKDNPYEAIKVIEAWKLNFNLGNALKYLMRAGRKGSLKEDLEKALWYVRREQQLYSDGEAASSERTLPSASTYSSIRVSRHIEAQGCPEGVDRVVFFLGESKCWGHNRQGWLNEIEKLLTWAVEQVR